MIVRGIYIRQTEGRQKKVGGAEEMRFAAGGRDDILGSVSHEF